MTVSFQEVWSQLFEIPPPVGFPDVTMGLWAFVRVLLAIDKSFEKDYPVVVWSTCWWPPGDHEVNRGEGEGGEKKTFSGISKTGRLEKVNLTGC